MRTHTHTVCTSPSRNMTQTIFPDTIHLWICLSWNCCCSKAGKKRRLHTRVLQNFLCMQKHTLLHFQNSPIWILSLFHCQLYNSTMAPVCPALHCLFRPVSLVIRNQILYNRGCEIRVSDAYQSHLHFSAGRLAKLLVRTDQDKWPLG